MCQHNQNRRRNIQPHSHHTIPLVPYHVSENCSTVKNFKFFGNFLIHNKITRIFLRIDCSWILINRFHINNNLLLLISNIIILLLVASIWKLQLTFLCKVTILNQSVNWTNNWEQVALKITFNFIQTTQHWFSK